MQKYFFNELLQVKELINELQSNPDNVKILALIQNRLLTWHFFLEGAVKKRKARLATLQKLKRSKDNTKQISLSIKKSIGICRDTIFKLSNIKLWARNIGNSIPHIYYDKYDLRPYAYSANSTSLKELSGDIFGKEGQELELTCWNKAISMGVKALLNDLTSIIRSGDLTLLREEPILIEVKTSSSCRKKAEKQLATLTAIQDYIMTDYSAVLRNGCLSRRVIPITEEKSRIDEFNSIFFIVKEKGYCASLIEDSVLCYSFVHGKQPKDFSFFDSSVSKFKKPLFISLNQLKNDLDHSLFYPYALSIKDPEFFSAFLCGYVSIYLLIDWQFFIDIASSEGIKIHINDFDFSLTLQKADNVTAISYVFTRALIELSSLSSAIKQACELYEKSLTIYSGQYKDKFDDT